MQEKENQDHDKQQERRKDCYQTNKQKNKIQKIFLKNT
jgi:hypothetical protein